MWDSDDEDDDDDDGDGIAMRSVILHREWKHVSKTESVELE